MKTKLLLVLALWLSLSMNVLGQDIKRVPVVKLTGIDGPDALGEMIVISANIDQSTIPTNLKSIRYKWTVLENGKVKMNVLPWPDGTKIIFAAGMNPKRMTVILDVDCLFETKGPLKVAGEDGKVLDKARIVDVEGKIITEAVTASSMESPELIMQEVIIGGNPPNPPDPTPVPPNPGPNPNPPLPVPVPDKFGLTKFTTQIFYDNVPSEHLKAGPYISNAFKGVAAQIAAGTLKGETAILGASKAANIAAIKEAGSDKAAWAQFDKLLGDKIYDLYKTKKIATNEDWADAFREISNGLTGAK